MLEGFLKRLGNDRKDRDREKVEKISTSQEIRKRERETEQESKYGWIYRYTLPCAARGG